MTPQGEIAIPAANAEYRHEDYHYRRNRQDWLYVPLERTPPIFIRWGKIGIGALMLGLLLAALFIAPHLLVEVLG